MKKLKALVMRRIAPRLMVLLMCGTALAACATTQPNSTASLKAAGVQTAKADAPVPKGLPTDVEGGVRQAHAMREAGQYDEAIHTLSQLMLVAADDPRVVSEYGKTLAQKGRAQEAVDFLKRATELTPNDWTVYSALGVAYDQLSDPNDARAAYEHALALRPAEPAVLNNYALSRMLANDPDGARKLMGRAQIAGGASDPKIARNIALLDKIAPAPETQDASFTVSKAAPQPAAASAPLAGVPVALAKGAPRSLPPMAQNMPQPNMPQPAFTPAPPRIASNMVVMQPVPVDPLAGPVRPASHAPRPLAAAAVAPQKQAAEAPKPSDSKPAPAKIADAKPAATKTAAKPAPVKTATAQPAPKSPLVKAKDNVPALRMAADMRSP